MKPIIYIFIIFIIIVVIFVVLTSTDSTSGWFSSCTKCKPGYYRGKNDDPTTCIGCNGGYSTNDLSGQTTCQICPKDTYAIVNSSSCSACANDTTTPTEGSVKCSATCFPGSRLATSDEKTNNGIECVDCVGHTFSDSYNATECTSCPNGTEIRSEIVGENGARTSVQLCTPCKPGTGANPDNTPGCSVCGENEYSDGWGEICQKCPDDQKNSEDHKHCWPSE